MKSKRIVPVLSVLLGILLLTLAYFYYQSQQRFQPPIHAEGISVADYSRHDLPPVIMGTRVTHLVSAVQFDNLLQDTPSELRPPSVILFQGFETCDPQDLVTFTQLAETVFPSRERLLVATYDMDANPVRAWFRFTPEMDLKARMGVKQCGEVVFVPRTCDGETVYCSRPTEDKHIHRVGCESFVDKCGPSVVKRFSESGFSREKLSEWVLSLVKQSGEPMISPVLGSYAKQEKWLLSRDEYTNDNMLRNYYLVEAFPAFTPLGFLASEIPPEFKQWMLDFWHRRKRQRRKENWDSSSSLISFHEEPTTFVDLDLEGSARDKIANDILKPLVEKWSGIAPLELTAFYGIREYYGNYLRSHVDRIDTHVLSVTFTLGKLNASNLDQLLPPEEEEKMEKWPLEVVGFDGEIYRHDHPSGVQILYESSKLIHGRPYHNRGPPHLGAFLHFKPVSMDLKQAQRWEDIASSARKNYYRNHVKRAYRSTQSKEPTMPRFSTTKYGDFSKLDNDKTAPKYFDVTFSHDANRELDLHWMNGKELVYQATLSSGTKFAMKTFVGHKFAWTEVRSTTILPKGRMEIERGSRHYHYS